MGKINASRVLLGGLLAGVVINLSEWFWNGVVFAKDMQDAMAALCKTMDMGGGTMAIFVCWGFLVGIMAVWLYAAVRPRFGAGAKTAILAGLAMWLLVYVQSTISMSAMGLFPQRLMMLGLPVTLVEIVAATWLGAWLYKEQPSA